MLRTFEHLVSAGFREFGTALERVSHYDLVLAVIPTVFLLTAVLGRAMSLPSRVVVAAASGLAALVVLDALFLNPPGTAD